jgi:hypothetical protein
MAERKALAITSPVDSGELIDTLYLVTGFIMATESSVWWVCFKASGRPTEPPMATIGSPSVVAVAAPVARLPVPGPEVTMHTPGLPVRRPMAPAINAAFCS